MEINNNLSPIEKTKRVFKSIADACINIEESSIVPLSEMVQKAQECFGGVDTNSEVKRNYIKSISRALLETAALPLRIDVSNEAKEKAEQELTALKGFRKDKKPCLQIIDDLIAPKAKMKAFKIPMRDFSSEDNINDTRNGHEYHLRTKHPNCEQGENNGIEIIKDNEGTLLRIIKFNGIYFSDGTAKCICDLDLTRLEKDSPLLKIINQRVALMDEEIKLREKSREGYIPYKRRSANTSML